MNRQEIYDRVKNSTKDAVILEEMKKFGFWKESDGQPPSVPEALILKEAELSKELYALLEKQRKYMNKEAALKAMRAERLQKSREKITENKRLREEKKKQKTQQWQEQKAKDIIYLGEGVSKGLANATNGDPEKLKRFALPELHTAEQLAQHMNISLAELRFLSYHRTVSRVSHYRQFQIPKKTGGFRNISAPMPRLKTAQYWILTQLLNKLPVHTSAHGFAKNKSIISNATPHLNKAILINIDLKDFFPSVHYPRVKGMFKGLGYNEKIASLLALICTESEMEEVMLDGKTYFVKTGLRALPQGAPASPAITNYLCRRLDARFAGLAKKYGFVYTRYADDLSFSCDTYEPANFKRFLGFVKKTIKDEGFSIHPDKLKIQRKNSKQEVTGIVVNKKLSVEKNKLKRFRATLHQVEKKGIEGRHWNYAPNFLASIKGYAHFIAQVDPAKGKKYLEKVNAILKQQQFKHTVIFKAKVKPENNPETVDVPLPSSEHKKEGDKKWWKFW